MTSDKRLFMKKLLKAWEKCPDLRFGQFLFEITFGINFYLLSDEELLEIAKKPIDELVKSSLKEAFKDLEQKNEHYTESESEIENEGFYSDNK